MGTEAKKRTRQILTALANYNFGVDMVFDKKFLDLQDNFDLKFIDVDEDTIRVVSIMKKDVE